MSEVPIVDNEYILEKFPGKGGWTFAAIPEILQDKHSHFGWVKVRGQIDNYSFSNYHLMPMGNGQLFLPVKKEVRKQIGKKEGDKVHVVLFSENEIITSPEEILLCIKEDTRAYQNFISLSEKQQNEIISGIQQIKSDTQKTERIIQLLKELSAASFSKNTFKTS